MAKVIIEFDPDRPDEVAVTKDGKRVEAWLSPQRQSWRFRHSDLWIANATATPLDVARMLTERLHAG